MVVSSKFGIKVNGLSRFGNLQGGTFPTVSPPSTNYRPYGSALYDDPNAVPPDWVTNRGTVIDGIYGAPFQSGTLGEPWTTHAATPQTMRSGDGWTAGPLRFRTDWTAGTSAATLFFQVTRKSGETAAYSTIKIETRRAELWGKTNGVWRALEGGGGAQLNVLAQGSYFSSTVEDTVAAPATVNTPNGHQSWAVPANARVLHATLTGWPRPVIPAGTTSLFARVWMRMVGAGTERPFMGMVGAAAYTSTTASTPTGNPWLTSRFKAITPYWQPFVVAALPLPVPATTAVGSDFWTAIRDETSLPNTVAVGSGY